MWKALYDAFLQITTLPWGKYISLNKAPGKAVRDNFQNVIYPQIGVYLIIVTVLCAAFFYYYLNNRFGRYYTKLSWFLTMLINSLLIALITYFTAKSLLNKPPISVSAHLLWLSIINSIYAAFLFFLLSLFIKWRSPMGKRTPF